MRGVKSTVLEILKWELAKTWRLKLRALEVVTRWRFFPYEKQRHLPVECFREFNWNKTDLANLDYRFLQTFTDSRNDFPRLHAWFRISQEKHLSLGFQNSNPQKSSFQYWNLHLAMFTIANFGSSMTIDVFLDWF